MLVVLVSYCAFLDCESVIQNISFLYFFVIYVWGPRFAFKWNKEVLDLDTKKLQQQHQQQQKEKKGRKLQQ